VVVPRLSIALAIQDRATALVLSHATQLIVQIATRLFLVLIQLNGPAFVV